MTRLIYLMNVSLDGFVEGPDRSPAWAAVDEEVHSWFNEETRRTDAFLYGRRLHEVMAYWRTAEQDPNATPAMLEFARMWNARPRIVFSHTLEPDPDDPMARVVRGDPVEEFAKLREEFPGTLSVAGPTLAAPFVRAGLVDEYEMVLHPVALGAGTPFWPPLDEPLRLRLTYRHEFSSGVVALRYETVRTG